MMQRLSLLYAIGYVGSTIRLEPVHPEVQVHPQEKQSFPTVGRPDGTLVDPQLRLDTWKPIWDALTEVISGTGKPQQ